MPRRSAIAFGVAMVRTSCEHDESRRARPRVIAEKAGLEIVGPPRLHHMQLGPSVPGPRPPLSADLLRDELNWRRVPEDGDAETSGTDLLEEF